MFTRALDQWFRFLNSKNLIKITKNPFKVLILPQKNSPKTLQIYHWNLLRFECNGHEWNGNNGENQKDKEFAQVYLNLNIEFGSAKRAA